MTTTQNEETQMSTITPNTANPVQPQPSPGREAMRKAGLVVLFGASTVATYVGLQTQMPLLFAPLLCALGGVFLPKGNVTRTVLFSIAAVGCVALAAMVALWLILLAMLSGAQF